MDWQPISTAPKTSRNEQGELQYVLLIARYPGASGWSDIYQAWWGEGARDWIRWPHHFPPTHWMPAPAPPSGKKNEPSVSA
jgi:hypothetical protein